LATISNPTDPNKVVATTSNVTPQAVQPQAASNPTGQYSTLQKYLGANQGSGQRLAGAIDNSLTAESKSLTDTTSRELNESDASNKRIGDLTGQTNTFTGKLNSANTTPAPVVSGGYDAAKYSSNLSGTQAAADIAANRSDLNVFRNISTGNTSDKLRADSEAEAKQAFSASQKAYNTNKDRQSQLSNFNDRSSLLQNAINSKNQRAGLQNLDNALLSQDKSGELNRINSGLQTNTKNLQEYKNLADARSRDVISLSSTQNAAEAGLNNRLVDMSKEQQADLESRKMSINEAKATQVASLNDKFNKFKSSGDVDDELYNALELANVKDVDAIARQQMGLSNPGKMTNPESQSIRMFNMDLLQRNALTGADVANQQDLDRLGVLNALSGGDIRNDLKLSDFRGSQLGPSSLDDTINQQGQNFLDTVNNRKYAMASGDAKSGGGDWYTGRALAEASNAEYLYKNQVRKALETNKNQSGGGHTGLDWQQELTPGEASSLNGSVSNYDLQRQGYNTGVLNTNFDDRSSYNYNQGSSGEAASKAEGIAVENVRSRIQQDLQNQGYQRLIKRMRQGT
jgi:hypothetical protein